MKHNHTPVLSFANQISDYCQIFFRHKQIRLQNSVHISVIKYFHTSVCPIVSPASLRISMVSSRVSSSGFSMYVSIASNISVYTAAASSWAINSSAEHPNKHLLHISLEFPMDVSLKSPDISSMSANRTGCYGAYSSRVLVLHTRNIL